MRRYHVVTLGCKLNQFDSARVEGVLRAGDFAPTHDPREADVIVLNTCTVTGRADSDGRRLARQLRRLNPSAHIVATGCFAERDPDALHRLGVLDDVVGHRDRARLPAALLGRDECVTASIALFFGDRSRAFVKVQEGCDLACSYCIIPKVRGPGVSTAAQVVVDEIRRLAARGVREIGLTGVNVGAWGSDLTPHRELADLVEEILAADLGVRIRLNSLEPRTVTPRLLALMAAAPDRLVPHIQIPLQSGSDAVLARMSRNYRTRHYRQTLLDAAQRVAGICLGADVITGFPGETPADHAETERFIAGLPLAYLHVFSYSSRPGTRAAELGHHVAPDVVRARTGALRALGEDLARRFRESLVGSVQDGLALDACAADGSRRVLTGNYVEVLLASAAPGDRYPVRLVRLEADGKTVRAEVAA